MKRILSGSLKHLAPTALLRLLTATAPSGILELVTDAGSLRLEIVKGGVALPSTEELCHAGRILECADGAFRFEPCELRSIDGDTLTLSALVDAAHATERVTDLSIPGGVAVDRLVAGDLFDMSQPSGAANIHVLPSAPLANPLDELLSDLESTAPSELLLTQVGVVAHDPRIWRGTLEMSWRRRGWQLRHFGPNDEVPVETMDVMVLHEEPSTGRTDLETSWIDLVDRACDSDPQLPVVWVGRLTDQQRMHSLIEAGVAFLMPGPHVIGGEAIQGFADALAQVVDRLLRERQKMVESRLPSAVCELVDTLLYEADSDQAVDSLLQLTAGELLRGAVFMVEKTAVRCRAGFGYELSRRATALPRGVGFLEQPVRSGEAIIGIDPASGGARQLARVLGVERLPSQTAVMPLGAGGTVVGLLVADREGQPLPDLRDLSLLSCCLGGIVVRSQPHSCVEMGRD